MRKLACCLGVVVLAGCGYRTRFDVPPHLQTFCVNTFRNKTLERNLDFEFTQALRREVQAKTRLRAATPDAADLVINGEIEDLERYQLRAKRLGKMEMRYLLYVNVEMLDRQKNESFFEGQRIVRWAEFSMNRGETDRQGLEEVVRELARRVVSLAFERWPTQRAEAKPRGG